MLMRALLGAPVSVGFVARVHERLAGCLEAAWSAARAKAARSGITCRPAGSP